VAKPGEFGGDEPRDLPSDFEPWHFIGWAESADAVCDGPLIEHGGGRIECYGGCGELTPASITRDHARILVGCSEEALDELERSHAGATISLCGLRIT
jgi:hypothetical protein